MKLNAIGCSFLLVLLSAQASWGQKLELYENSEKLKPGGVFLTTLSFVPASVLMLTNHEIGHTVFAKISGDASASFKYYEKKDNGGACVGCTTYDHTKLSRFGNAIVPASGFLFSQGLAVGTDQLLKNVPMSKGLQRTVALTYFLAKFDMSFQVVQGLLKLDHFQGIKYFGTPSGTDIVSFSYFAANGNRRGYNWVAVGMALISVADIYLSRKSISRNWKILTNKRYYRRKQATAFLRSY